MSLNETEFPRRTDTSIGKDVAWGILLWVFLAFFTSGVYFEQWWWKIDLWFRYYYLEHWPVAVTLEGIASILVLGVFLFVILPILVKRIVRSTRPIRSLDISIATLFVTLAVSYGISELVLSGTAEWNRVLRDVGGSLISFVFSITLVVLVPLAFILLGMLWWRSRTKTKK